MKKWKSLLLMEVLLLALIQPAQSSDMYNRVHVSVTLSGHILFGVGVEHGFTEHHALQITVYPLVVPGKGFPFAMQAGYNYYWGGSLWKGKVGFAGGVIVSPPDPDKRRYLPMLMLTPGVRYADKDNFYTGALWLARFLGKTNQKWPIVPIGIEARYGRAL